MQKDLVMWYVQEIGRLEWRRGLRRKAEVGLFHTIIAVIFFKQKQPFFSFLKIKFCKLLSVNLNGLRIELIKKQMHVFPLLNF